MKLKGLPKRNRATAALVVLAMATLTGGCAQVPVAQQQRVSKPNMVFEQSGPFAAGARLLPQVEPGTESGGAASAAGCTACR